MFGSATGWLSPPPPMPPPPPWQACAAAVPVAQQFTAAAGGPGGYVLGGAAALISTGDATVPGDGVALTRRGQTGTSGYVALNVSTALADCACGSGGGGLIISANITTGGGGARGDGLLLALVDATLQAPPPLTAFMAVPNACGLKAVRPLNSLIVEFDTFDDSKDTTCGAIDGVGAGFRLVRTYGAGSDEELLPVLPDGPSCAQSCTIAPALYSGAWWELQIAISPADGGTLSVYAEGVPRMSWTNFSIVPSSFYLLAAGRTSTLSSDLNGVANLRLECANARTLIGLTGQTPWGPDDSIAHSYDIPQLINAAPARRGVVAIAAAMLAAAALL